VAFDGEFSSDTSFDLVIRIIGLEIINRFSGRADIRDKGNTLREINDVNIVGGQGHTVNGHHNAIGNIFHEFNLSNLDYSHLDEENTIFHVFYALSVLRRGKGLDFEIQCIDIFSVLGDDILIIISTLSLNHEFSVNNIFDGSVSFIEE